MKFILIVSMLLVNCATSYGPDGWGGGYTDIPLGNDKYIVNFRGNGHTKASTVEKYAHQRAKELCKENGFSGYEMLDSQEKTDTKVWDDGKELSTSKRHRTKLYIQCMNVAH